MDAEDWAVLEGIWRSLKAEQTPNLSGKQRKRALRKLFESLEQQSLWNSKDF